MMSHKGFSHIGLATLDLDKTREFYEDILGFRPVVADTIKIKEGGRITPLLAHSQLRKLITAGRGQCHRHIRRTSGSRRAAGPRRTEQQAC